MNQAGIQELRKLAESWRAKATAVENRYKQEAPQQTLAATSALETCAEELEEFITLTGEKSGVLGEPALPGKG